MSNAQNQDNIKPQGGAKQFKCKTFWENYSTDIDDDVMEFIKDMEITRDKILNYTSMVVHTDDGPKKYVHIAWYDDPEIPSRSPPTGAQEFVTEYKRLRNMK